MADDYGASTGAGNLGSITVGGSATGTVEVSGDRDWFAITLVAGQGYKFTLDGTTLSDPFLALRDSAGGIVSSNDDANGTLNSEILFTAASSGTYYLDCFGQGGETGTYTLTAVTDSSAPPSNDDYAASTLTTGSVAIGGSSSGTLEAGLDHDWFAVTLTAGTTYVFNQNAGTLSDPRLSLRDSLGNAVASNDDANNSLDAEIVFTCTVSGTYYLDCNSADGTDTGTYTIAAAVDTSTPPADDYTAQVGSPGNGTVTVGGSATGEVEIALDHDWFAVTLTEGSIYRIDLDGGTMLDPLVRVRDASGAQVAFDDDSGGGWDAELTFTATSSGTFYIDAASADSAGTGTYTLSVTLLYGAPQIDANTGATVTEGAAVTITTAMLETIDPDSAAGDLVYTLTSTSLHGTLYRDGVALGLSATFSQADIDNGLISYVHDGGEIPGDSFGFEVTDGTTTISGKTFTFTIDAVNDPVATADDAFTTGEDTVVTGNVFADNGHGADTDPDGSSEITEVAGDAANVGITLTLPSGALVTIDAAGVLSYDPNGAFDYLGVGYSTTDSFTYTATGGDTATVTVTITGVDSDDAITGTLAADTLFGGIGNDTIRGQAGDDDLSGGTGDDWLSGGAGADALAGGDGNDVYVLTDGNDTVTELAGEGYDMIRGIGVDVTLAAGSEIELVQLYSGDCDATGNELENILIGSNGANTLSGMDGQDHLFGYGGDDTLVGGGANDDLTGGGGRDTLSGGIGRDILAGGSGTDTLTGGTGVDDFVFTALTDSARGVLKADTVTDFSHAQGDRIDLHALDAISGGANDPFNFIGTAQFSHTAGELRYRFDGAGNTIVSCDVNGDGAADMAIVLTGQVALVESDFVL